MRIIGTATKNRPRKLSPMASPMNGVHTMKLIEPQTLTRA
jgi:hypothetical protein